MKLARLAGPPLTGIPATMNTKTARATKGGRIRASTAVGAATASENSAIMQSQVRAGSDQRAVDLTLRNPGRCAGLAVVAPEAESPGDGAVQGVLDLAGYRSGTNDADRKVMRGRLMESAEG